MAGQCARTGERGRARGRSIERNDHRRRPHPGHIVGRAPITRILEGRADASLFDIMEECERRIIVDMLEKCNWNQTDAAERFRVPLSTLNQKIKRLNIEIRKKVRD